MADSVDVAPHAVHAMGHRKLAASFFMLNIRFDCAGTKLKDPCVNLFLARCVERTFPDDLVGLLGKDFDLIVDKLRVFRDPALAG